MSTQEVLVAWTDPSLLDRLLDPTDLALCVRESKIAVSLPARGCAVGEHEV